MRTLFALLYCLVFSIGCAILFAWHRPADPVIVAARELPAGQALQAGDVTVLDDKGQIPLLGRYTSALVPALKPVTAENTVAFPDMAPKAGRVRLIVPVRRSVVDLAPVKGPFPARICQGAEAVGGNLMALSAGCAGANGGCSAVVDLAASQAGPVVAAFGKTPAPTLERIDGNCGS